MSKEQTDLLPCPFCGSADIATEGPCYTQFMCEGCGAATYDQDGHAEAIAAWNRRASPSPAGGVQGVTEETVERAKAADLSLRKFLADDDRGGELAADDHHVLVEVMSTLHALTAALATPLTEGGERNAVIEECAKVADRMALAYRSEKAATDKPTSAGSTGALCMAIGGEASAAAVAKMIRALKSGATDA